MAPLLDAAARAGDIALLEPIFVCMPLIGTTSLKRYFPEVPNYTTICAEEYAPILTYIREHDDIQVVVLAAAWSSQYAGELYRHEGDTRSREIGINLMREGIKELATSLGRDHSRQFLIISDVPPQGFDVGCLARSYLLLRASCPDTLFMKRTQEVRDQQPTDAMIRALPTEIPNVSVSIPHDHLCGLEGCTTVVNNEFIYRDAVHLRRNLTAETKIQLSNLLHLRESLEEAVDKLSRPQ
jgi:hypothetical protein